MACDELPAVTIRMRQAAERVLAADRASDDLDRHMLEAFEPRQTHVRLTQELMG